MLRIAALLFVSLTLVARSGAAQQTPPLRTNDRVRIVAPSAGIPIANSAVVLQTVGDSLSLQFPNFVQRKIAISSIQTLDVSRGPESKRRWAINGAAIGSGIGVISGMVLRGTVRRTTYSEGIKCYGASCGTVVIEHRSQYPLTYVAAGGALSAALGAFIGSRIPGDRWERVPLGGTVGAAPTPEGGMKLGFTLRTR